MDKIVRIALAEIIIFVCIDYILGLLSKTPVSYTHLMCTPNIQTWWSMYNAELIEDKKYSPMGFEAYMKDILFPKRFPTLPLEPHWEYFKRALLNIEPKRQEATEMLMYV